MNLFENHMLTAILAEALVSVLLLALGYLVGKYRERRQLHGRDLTDYDFYPYQTTADNFAEFSLRDFRLGMHYLLRNRDARAARQLIFIGEQNNVRELLDNKDKHCLPEAVLQVPMAPEMVSDANEYMENYRNIVRLLGRTFPQMGIEIVLHDLANPSRSVVWIEGAEVTGRSLHMGTTTLLVDLEETTCAKRRQAELRAQSWCAAIQMHDHSDYPKGVRGRGCHLHEHRHQLHSGRRA